MPPVLGKEIVGLPFPQVGLFLFDLRTGCPSASSGRGIQILTYEEYAADLNPPSFLADEHPERKSRVEEERPSASAGLRG